MTEINPQDTENNTTDTEQELTLIQSVFRNATGLAIFAFITAGVIAITQQSTAEKIRLNIAEAQARALYEITPKNTVNNDLLNDALTVNALPNIETSIKHLLGPIDKNDEFYFAKMNNTIHTVIYPAIAPDGYTTAIKLLIGIKMDGTISGVRVVDHKETPGLGDKIELKKSNWVLTFQGKSLSIPTIERWKVKKDDGDFDQFTGATITPRAVVNAVKNTLLFHQENIEKILELKRKTDQSTTKTEGENQ